MNVKDPGLLALNVFSGQSGVKVIGLTSEEKANFFAVDISQAYVYQDQAAPKVLFNLNLQLFS